MKRAVLKLSLPACLAVLAPTLAGADGPSTAPAVPDIESILGSLPDLSPRRFPSVFGVPSAIGPQGGTGFVALTYVDPRSGVSGNGSDGDLAAGYTIGDAATSVGLTFGVGITSLKDFGDDGALFLSASRQVHTGSQSSTYIGLQASNLAAWGDADDEDEAFSGQVSHLTRVASGSGASVPIQLTVGYGNETTLRDDGSGIVGEGAFVGVGVGFTEFVSGSLSATQTQLNVGFGLSVPNVPNLGFSAGVFDVTDNADRRQFSLTGALSF